MSIFDTVRKVFVTTEADVLAFAAKVWQEEKVAGAEILSAFKWIQEKGLPSLLSELQAITPFVGLLGDLSGHPELRTEMAALDIAMAGIHAFANTANAGQLSADDVVKGYGSLRQASAAAQQVVSTAAIIVAVTPASKS